MGLVHQFFVHTTIVSFFVVYSCTLTTHCVDSVADVLCYMDCTVFMDLEVIILMPGVAVSVLWIHFFENHFLVDVFNGAAESMPIPIGDILNDIRFDIEG